MQFGIILLYIQRYENVTPPTTWGCNRQVRYPHKLRPTAWNTPLPPPHPLIIIILRSPPPHPQGAWPTTATLLQSSYDHRFKVGCSGLQAFSQPSGVPRRMSRDACTRRHLLLGSASAFIQLFPYLTCSVLVFLTSKFWRLEFPAFHGAITWKTHQTPSKTVCKISDTLVTTSLTSVVVN